MVDLVCRTVQRLSHACATVEQSSNLPSIAFCRLGSMGSRLAGFQMAFSLCRHAGSVEYHQLACSHARVDRKPDKVQKHC